ncbi:60S ribosomal protein L24 [Teratosphaeria destructans]|uniref:60S ribosomal protein L24 n=1 Tax=Teratosphaeria destructans TaxID=418781 RepID=A0A9W7T1T7_9PEZI|nr:60S ribosomal protein L24 [Teratosphaeria destructans]
MEYVVGRSKDWQTNTIIRASSSSAVTARSSVSRTARASRSSSSARTPAASIGLCFAGDRGERVSLRYGYFLSGSFGRYTKVAKQEQAKTRRRRQVKAQRAVVGASLDVIKERRSQRPEARSAARSQAIKEGKEKRAAAQSLKKAEKAKTAAAHATGRVVGKQAAKGAQSKPKPTSR